MPISAGDVDLFDGATLSGGEITAPGYAYFSPTAAVLQAGQEVSVEFDYTLGGGGWMEWAAYSMNPSGSPSTSSQYQLSPGGRMETSGTLGFTMSPALNAGDDALTNGETRVSVLFTGCTITDIRVVTRPMPTAWGLTTLDPTPQNGTQYWNYYPTPGKVWDDVALVVWSSFGYTSPTLADYFEARAVRWTASGSPGLGTVHVEPDTLGAYASITHCLRAGPGRAFITAGQVNRKNILGWVVSVDQNTLGITVESMVQHPTGITKDPWVVACEQSDGCMALFFDNVTGAKTLVRVLADGTTLFAYPPTLSAGDDDASNNYWHDTVAFTDMGGYWVRHVVAEGNVTARTYKVYEHAKDGNGFPSGNGTLRFSRAETVFLGAGTQWGPDSVHAVKVGPNTIHVMQHSADLRHLRLHVLDTSAWTLTDEGHNIGRAWGASAGNHQDDQMSLKPMYDRPGHSILGWNMRHPASTARSKTMVSTFDGIKAMDTAVCISQVVGQGGVNTESWDTANGWEVCYLGAGKFIGVAWSDFTATVTTHAASVCGLIVWAAGAWRIFVTEDMEQ